MRRPSAGAITAANAVDRPADRTRCDTDSRRSSLKASWYGPGLAGRKTTSGEIFNPRALTAASRALPLGSVVKVTNPQNGKSVSVRINDRGPFVPGRSLDLSRHAAEKLGIIHMGVASVKVTKASSQADISSDY